MEKSLFYTFSTIAQTLAGAIALLAAFILYRLQLLNVGIQSIGERLASWVEQVSQQPPRQVDGLTPRRLHGRGQYRELLDLSNRIAVPANFYRAEPERERLPLLLADKDALRRRFKFALYLTGGLIAVSVVVLTVTSRLAVSSLVYWVLAVAAVWFSACMLSYVWLLRNVFR